MKKTLLKHGACALVFAAAAFGATALVQAPSPAPLADAKDGDTVTIGLTQDLSAATNSWVLTSTEDLKISEAGDPSKGAETSIYKNKTAKTIGGKSTQYYWRTGDPANDSNAEKVFLSYDVVIPAGYTLNISKISAELATQDTAMDWYVYVLDANGTAQFTSTKQSTKAKETKSYSTTIDVKGLSGKATVKIRVSSSVKTKYFTVPQLTIDATLVKDERATYTVTTSMYPENTGEISETTEFPEGNDAILTATPKWGYKFVKWTVDNVDVEGNPYTISGINANHTAVATFEKLPWITFAKSEGVDGDVPAKDYADGPTYTLPRAYNLYKEGYSHVGWSDGENSYKTSDVYNVSGDVTFTAEFAENNVALGEDETIVNWVFATKDGAPSLNYGENKIGYYAQSATINGESIDVVMRINTMKDAGISGKTGKCVTSGDNRVQMNGGTVLEIPAVKGMTVTVTATNTGKLADSSILFNGAEGTKDGSTLIYTYNGNEPTLKLIDQGNDLWPAGVKVVYPKYVEPTACTAPTAEVSAFNFEKKGYSITFNAAAGEKLMVSVDGADAVEMESPATLWNVANASAYAFAEGLEDSEVVEAAVPENSYDPEKPYIAWVYIPTYDSAKIEGYTDNALIKALKEIGNVVLVEGADGDKPADDLKNADLIVCGEAMAGAKTFSNGMKDFVGVTNMINLKFFNYTFDSNASKNRWGWGAPANPNPKTDLLTPNKDYKVLDGVTYNEDGTISMFTAGKDNSKNHVQTVAFDNAPEGNIVLATADGGKTAMHCADKFFGIGLSSDDWKNYGDNAVTIVTNAAKMLLAGEDLAEVVPQLPVISMNHDNGVVKFENIDEDEDILHFTVEGLYDGEKLKEFTFGGTQFDINEYQYTELDAKGKPVSRKLAPATVHTITPYVNGEAADPIKVLTKPVALTKWAIDGILEQMAEDGMEMTAEELKIADLATYETFKDVYYITFPVVGEGVTVFHTMPNGDIPENNVNPAPKARRAPAINLDDYEEYDPEYPMMSSYGAKFNAIAYSKADDLYSALAEDIETIVVEALGEEFVEAKVYDLNGREVKGEAAPGIYILVKGKKSVKVVIR